MLSHIQSLCFWSVLTIYWWLFFKFFFLIVAILVVFANNFEYFLFHYILFLWIKILLLELITKNLKPCLNFLYQPILKSIIIIIFQIFLNLISYLEKLIIKKFKLEHMLAFWIIKWFSVFFIINKYIASLLQMSAFFIWGKQWFYIRLLHKNTFNLIEILLNWRHSLRKLNCISNILGVTDKTLCILLDLVALNRFFIFIYKPEALIIIIFRFYKKDILDFLRFVWRWILCLMILKIILVSFFIVVYYLSHFVIIIYLISQVLVFYLWSLNSKLISFVIIHANKLLLY